MKDSETETSRLLIIGIGNTGRGDDGLGWKFADLIRDTGCTEIDLEYRYQLQVEDAELISHYQHVLFVDATQERLQQGFEVKQCEPAGHYYFSSHLQTPEAIIYLAKEIFNSTPNAYTLAISGMRWELTVSISKKAADNLQQAMHYCKHTFLPSILH